MSVDMSTIDDINNTYGNLRSRLRDEPSCKHDMMDALKNEDVFMLSLYRIYQLIDQPQEVIFSLAMSQGFPPLRSSGRREGGWGML